MFLLHLMQKTVEAGQEILSECNELRNLTLVDII
jgi:hypothetical protein